MGISFSDENDLRDLLQGFKKEHRVRNTVVIIMTDDKIMIDPMDKNKFKKLTSEASYGIGFQDGRNDLHNEMAGKFDSTKQFKEYQ